MFRKLNLVIFGLLVAIIYSFLLLEEDVIMGNCLRNVGVKNMNSTDSNGRYLFLPFYPSTGIGKTNWTNYGHWFWNYLEHKNRKGFDFPSDRVVSFHYVSPEMIEFLEYMIYGIKKSDDKESH